MPSKATPGFLDKIRTLCDDNASLQSKIGIISLSNSHHTPTFDKFVLLYEYLQLIIPLLSTSLPFQNEQEADLAQALFYGGRFFIPSFWVIFQGLHSTEIIILILVGTFIALKYLLLLYIVLQVIYGQQVHISLQRLWQTIFSLQGRVIFFGTTSIFLNSILTVNTGGTFEKTNNKTLIVIVVIVIITDFAFTIFLNVYYHYILPTKKFLSAKSNIVEMITFIQKLMLQVLYAVLDQNAPTTTWIFILVSLALDLLRNIVYFKTLPFYNFKTLSYQANLLASVTSLSISYFVLVIIKTADPSYSSLKLLIGLWVIFSFFLGRIVQNFLHNRLWNLLFNPRIKSPMLLIHRVSAIKQLEKFTTGSYESKERHPWTLLANRTLNPQNIQRIFGIEGTQLSIDINSKESLNLLLKEYLRKLVVEYPSHAILQLFAARFFAKKFKLYSEVVNIAKAFREKDGIQIKMNAELILIELQNIIKGEYLDNTHQEEIDPDSFIREQFLSAQLKTAMLEQAKAQLTVYHEMKQENPDIFCILKTAQQINTLRQNICKQIRNIRTSLSEYNLEPFNLTAQYVFALNHSMTDRQKVLNIYTQRFLKYRKIFNQECFTRMNIFQDSVGFVIFSGSASSLGNIVLATKPMEKIFGGDFRTYPGQKIESRVPPIVRTFHGGFNNFLSENNYADQLNKITKGFSYTQERYLVQVDFSLHIHPFVTHGFYFIYVCRPVISNKDFMLLYENGDIDSTTKNIDCNLGIQKYIDERGLKINVKDISFELALINEAFNIIASPNKAHSKSKMTQETAQDIYDLYTSTGKDILLSSFDEENSYRHFSYHCKVEGSSFGEKYVKTIILTENKRENQLNCNKKTKESPQNKCSTNDLDNQIEEEKSIDFEPITSLVYTSVTKKNLISEESPRNRITTPAIFISSPRNEEQALKKYPEGVQMHSEDEETYNQESEALGQNKSSINGSSNSKANQQRRVETSFKASLNMKSSSRVFHFLCSAFYLVILALVIAQIVIIATLDENTTNLKTRKDILRNAQLRNFLSVNIEALVRIIWEYDTGVLTSQVYAPLAGGDQPFRDLTRTYLQQLVEANQELLEKVGSFDQNVNYMLFHPDIKIYDTYFNEPVQSYQEFNTFQAVDRLTDSILAFLNNNASQITSEANSLAQFIFRNALNDVILKNEDIVIELGQTLAKQHKKALGTVENYRTVALVILSSSIFVILGLLWRATQKQERNLSAFCRLNAQKLTIVAKRCKDFKEMIENDKVFDVEARHNNLYQSIKFNTRREKRETMKEPNTKGLYKNLRIQIFKLLILILVLYGIIFTNYGLAHKSVNTFQSANLQIGMIDYLQVQTVLAIQTYRELISTNNTALICNQNSTDQLPLQINTIRALRALFFQSLINADIIEENPEINQLLLGDACKFLDSSSQPFCLILKSLGKKTGLIYLLTDLENEITDGLQTYLASDKSSDLLADMKKTSFQSASPVYVIASRSQAAVGNILNQRLEDKLSSTRHRRNIFLGIFVSLLLIVGLFGWALVLREFKEAVNHFKNVLKLLPAELVLSSFILKTFLMKTSKGALDSIKHDI